LTTYVALLRSINVGGHKMVPMKELRSLSERLGFIQAHTLLQSGNLIFRSEVRSAKNLEKMLETETEKYFGFAVEYFVRSAEEWHDIIARNPFQAYARKDPAHLVAILLKEKVVPGGVKALQASIEGSEEVRGGSRHVYVIYPDGIGKSRVTLPVIESKLGTSGTGRNWNTVVKLGGEIKE